ncbi:MAG: glycogen synthase GlgA [Nitrospirota bacterium]|nr:glycogen synthase GlgA [Nitrospirota bacterium]
MKILFASSEAAPFAKTGGLADVSGTLPKFIREMGHDVRLIIPLHQCIDEGKFNLRRVAGFFVPVGERQVEAEIFEGRLGDLPVYFIKKDRYFDRPELYGTSHGDYPDNAERFVFFSRGVIEAANVLGFHPDVIHCNDWQAALVPAYLKTLYNADPFFGKTASVLTVHNLAYQGVFWHLDLPMTGLSWDLFTPEFLEFYGKINFLKAGLVFADILTTVSKTYSKEVQTPEHGWGLDGVLRIRKKELFGIVNGIDAQEWDPGTDREIASSFSARSLKGKDKNRKALREEMGLADTSAPLLAFVGRLAGQKGVDLLAEVIERLGDTDCQFVVLGSGEEHLQRLLVDVANRHPGRVAVHVGFDAGLARRVYAGADMFLMPSRYEPCGIGQLISLRYGTIPVVHRTGGLADTVSEFSATSGKGNGFTFRELTVESFAKAIQKAVKTYQNRPAWTRLVKNAMACDFSWDSSAEQYLKLYEKAVRMRTAK